MQVAPISIQRELGYVADLRLDHGDLSFQTIKHGTIVPKRSCGLPVGIYDKNMDPVGESSLVRGQQVIFAPESEGKLTKIEQRSERVLFGGYYFNHYGHFITESISRLWAASVLNDLDKIIFVSIGIVPGRLRDEILYDLLPKNAPPIEILDHACSFNEVVVPQPGFVIRRYFNHNHWAWLRRLSQEVVEPEEHNSVDTPLYLSRSNAPESSRYAFGEKELEEGLREAGIKVVHPEKHSFSEQIRLVSMHKTVIGLEGSQLHSMIFTMGKKISIQLDFRRVNPNYVMIDSMIGNIPSYPRLAVPKLYDAFTFGHGFDEPYIFDPQEAGKSIGSTIGIQINAPELTQSTRRSFAVSWIDWWGGRSFGSLTRLPRVEETKISGTPTRIDGITYQQYQTNVRCLLDAL